MDLRFWILVRAPLQYNYIIVPEGGGGKTWRISQSQPEKNYMKLLFSWCFVVTQFHQNSLGLFYLLHGMFIVIHLDRGFCVLKVGLYCARF